MPWTCFLPNLRVEQQSKVTIGEMAISCTFHQGLQTTSMASLGTEHMILKSSQGHVSWVAPGWHSLILPLALELSLEAISGHRWGGKESEVPYREDLSHLVRPANTPKWENVPPLLTSPTKLSRMMLFLFFFNPLFGQSYWAHQRLVAKHCLFLLELQKSNWFSQHFCLCV